MLEGPQRPCTGWARGVDERSVVSGVLGIWAAPQEQRVCRHCWTHQSVCMLDLFLLKAVGILMSFEDITET